MAVIAALATALLAVQVGAAVNPDPDGEFASGGLFLSTFGVNPQTARFEDIALTSDGRIIAVGDVEPGTRDSPGKRLAVARLTASGELDASFNPGGTPAGLHLSAGTGDWSATAVAVQPDGKILVAGRAGDQLIVQRLLSNGGLDTGFAAGSATPGRFTSSFGHSFAAAEELAIRPDGSVVVVGSATTGTATRTLVAVLEPGGTLRTSFGTGGAATYDYGGGGSSRARAVRVDSTGRIVLAGMARQSGVDRMLVARLGGASGAPDGTFGGASGAVLRTIAVHGTSQPASAEALLLRAGDRPVAAGHFNLNGTLAVGLVALEANGGPDAGFGEGGLTYQVIGDGASARDLVFDEAGSLLVAGSGFAGSQERLMVARYTALGQPDSSFDPSGAAEKNHRLYPFGSGTFSYAAAAEKTTAGRLVVAGRARTDDDALAALVARIGGTTQAPLAAFDVSWDAIEGQTKPLRPGQTATFDASPSSDPDGEVVAWDWDLDKQDGFEKSGQSVSGSFSESGTHDVTLRVRDNDGIIGTVTKHIPVKWNDAPTAVIEADQAGSPRAGTPYRLTSRNSKDLDGKIKSRIWDVNGDGNYDYWTAHQESVDVYFPSGGQRTVRLRVEDDEGAVQTVSRTFEVAHASFELEPVTPIGGDAVFVAPNSETTLRFRIKRAPGASYGVTVSRPYVPVSSLKPLLNGKYQPSLTLAGPKDNEFTLTLKAGKHFTNFKNNTLTLTASKFFGYGQQPEEIEKQVSFDVKSVGWDAARLTGVEVTQGIQKENESCYPQGNLAPGAGQSGFWYQLLLKCRENASVDWTTDKQGNPYLSYDNDAVPLVAGKKTIVRVYGNRRGGTGESLHDVKLTAYHGGKVLGTLASQSTMRKLPDQGGHARASLSDRADPAASWWFTLPPEWTWLSGLSLEAELLPAVAIGKAPAPPVPTAPMYVVRQRAMTLENLRFRATGYIDVGLVRLWRSGEMPGTSGLGVEDGFPDKMSFPSGASPLDWPRPAQVMSLAETWAPLADGNLRYSAGYSGEVFLSNDDVDVKDARWKLDNAADENYDCGKEFCGDQVLGVFGAGTTGNGVSLGCIADCAGLGDDLIEWGGDLGNPVAVARWTRPDTVAHEMFHGWGADHSFSEESCAGADQQDQVGEQMDVSGRAYLNGVGVDPRPYPGTTSAGPFRVLAPALLGASRQTAGGGQTRPQDWYADVMSYCVGTGMAGDRPGRRRWPSVEGWQQLFERARAIAVALGRHKGAPPAYTGTAAASARDRRAPARRVLIARAADGPEGAEILGVNRRVAQKLRGTGGRYLFRALDRSGAVLAEAPALAQRGDEGPLFLSAELDAPAATAIVLMRDGVEVARRDATPNPPVVRITAPSRGERVRGTRPVAIRWTAADVDGDELVSTVSYSTDGGRTYRLLAGRDGNEAVLPPGALARSNRARVRVRVNDGFHDSVAESGVFRSDGAPPTVDITSPGSGIRPTAGTQVYLSGRASDDSGRPLDGAALRWKIGKRQIGRGGQVLARLTRAGAQRVRLVARDRHGRTSSKSVRIRVAAARPQLTLLAHKKRVSKKARRVRLRLATNVTTTVRIGKQRFRTSPRARKIKVRVKRGRKPLRLTLRLGRGSRATSATVVVKRR